MGEHGGMFLSESLLIVIDGLFEVRLIWVKSYSIADCHSTSELTWPQYLVGVPNAL